MKVSSVQVMEAGMRLEGKVAFISGAARGMGAVEAKLFAQEGARVAIGDVLDEEGYKVVEEISESGGEALFVHLDVTDEGQWQNAISTTVRRFGKLDILVNNAGVGGHSLVEHTTVEEWDRVMDINAKGVFLGTKSAIPEMRRAARESIRANSVHPGPIITPMTEATRADAERYQLTLSRIPLGRYGQPEDVAYGVLFLASDESSFMTGSELVIDGGWTAQ
jgi:NAD(P)-dependent dehydrogenase (short-subunit alcohol dehydrogenase family)